MAAGKQKTTAASHAPSPAPAALPEAHSKKSKKKKRAATKPLRDDVDALAPDDALDFGTLPAPDEGLAEAIAAVLDAPRAAASGGGTGGGQHLGVAGADATAAAQAELLATANELYQRMDAGGGGLRPDGAYWAALPAHIRNFVRTASLSPPLRAAGGNERAKAQAMYAIAQQMVQTGEQGGEGQVPSQAVAGVGSERDVSSSAAAGQLVAGWQGDISLPVDPSFFADAAFTAALEQQGDEENGIIGVGVGVAEVTKGEGGDSDERSGFHSIVSAGEEGERMPTAGKGPVAEERSGRDRGRRRKSVGHGPVSGVSVGEVEEDDREIPTRDGKLVTSSVVSDLLPKAEAAAAAAAAAASAAARAAQAAKAKASQLNMPSQTRQPSSRAQGKQPMNYPPPPSGTTTTTTTSTMTSTTAQQKTNTPSPTTRSSRAASKAPLQPHPHPHPHTHTHHHPSPPSSNTSQTQKHRPPSSQAPSSRNNANSNSKIWSTSSTEERERIKEFWLGLGEEDRRNLVKLEKEAVLKKMKEQQRHSCACAVCGRKRSVCQFRLWVFFKPVLIY